MYCNVRPENIQFGRQYQERCHGKIQKKLSLILKSGKKMEEPP